MTMINRVTIFVYKLFFSALIFSLAGISALAQAKLPEPQDERLLNGLKLLMWSNTGDKNVSVRVRIHSGSAFDPQGKEGVMKLLAENIFPNESAREFFAEDLGGGLEIVTTYDYIQINASGKPESLLQMLETLASAISNPVIDKETTAKLRTALISKVNALESNPDYVADRAAAKRLFGTTPYGRPEMGTAESIGKIDFADLIDAKIRFLTADNATLAITGNFDKSVAFRAVRRYFGSWLKSEKRVPATFQMPDAPDTKQIKIELPEIKKSYVRTAWTAPARNSRDYYSMLIYSDIRRDQRCGEAYQANLLRGIYIRRQEMEGKELPVYSGPCPLPLLTSTGTETGISQDDFSRAKSRITSAISAQTTTPIGLADYWLDVDTFKLASVNEDIKAANSVAYDDVKAMAQKLASAAAVQVSLVPVSKTTE